MNENELAPGQVPCPRCGGPLAHFSPSGRGVAACDACQTWWSECPLCGGTEETGHADACPMSYGAEEVTR